MGTTFHVSWFFEDWLLAAFSLSNHSIRVEWYDYLLLRHHSRCGIKIRLFLWKNIHIKLKEWKINCIYTIGDVLICDLFLYIIYLIICNIINRELCYHWSLAPVFKQIIIATEGPNLSSGAFCCAHHSILGNPLMGISSSDVSCAILGPQWTLCEIGLLIFFPALPFFPGVIH